jgi:glycine cleavage system aminomethyltransferase T
MSPDLGCGVAIGMIDSSHWDPATSVVVQSPEGQFAATVCDLPFAVPTAEAALPAPTTAAGRVGADIA